MTYNEFLRLSNHHRYQFRFYYWEVKYGLLGEEITPQLVYCVSSKENARSKTNGATIETKLCALPDFAEIQSFPLQAPR